MNSIAIFVDVQNIYYTTRQAFGRFFDYSKLWRIAKNQGEISIAKAYAIKRDREDQIKFQNRLRAIGFDVRLKPYIQRQDGSSKGDWDVGITIDILECAPKVNKIILLSGDGDFSLLLDKLKEKTNVQTEVYGVPALTADSLIKAANSYRPIDENLLVKKENY